MYESVANFTKVGFRLFGYIVGSRLDITMISKVN